MKNTNTYTFQKYQTLFIKWLISDTIHLRKSFTNIYTLCAMKNVHSVSSSVHVRWGARRAESEEKKKRWGSQASFSVGTAVQGQYKLLTMYRAVLLFPQCFQLCTPIGQHMFFFFLNMSFDQSKSQNTKEEGDCSQAQSQNQVDYPVQKKKKSNTLKSTNCSIMV